MEIDRAIIYQRTLRTSRYIAHSQHACDYCHNPIEPGDEYEKEIVAVHIRFLVDCRIERTISTWRRHTYGCEPPEEDEDDFAGEDTEPAQTSLPLAA